MEECTKEVKGEWKREQGELARGKREQGIAPCILYSVYVYITIIGMNVVANLNSV